MPTMPAMRKPKPQIAEGGNTKVTRAQWLDLALETLIKQGVDGVRILPLAQQLGVSRSSFYWYFKSRQDLLDQLLQHWRGTNTGAIVERAKRSAATIIHAVLNVFECWADERLFNPQLDFAIRSWARRSKSVRRSVDDADNARLEAIRDMYIRHGYGGEDAFIRARVLYYMQIGYYTLEVREPMAVRFSHIEAYLRSFTGKEPTAGDVEYFHTFLTRANKL
jgi:AcrR family transcriptional regulator